MMALRQLLIERPPTPAKRSRACISVQVSDETRIGPWITTVAARFGYPLTDRFGAPILYRLRSLPDGNVLPASGCFADAHFHSGCRFHLEVESDTTIPMQAQALTSTTRPSTPPLPRRSLLIGGTLTTFSLFGLGSGITAALAQTLLQRRPILASQGPLPNALTLTVRTTFTQHQQAVKAVTWARDESMIAS